MTESSALWTSPASTFGAEDTVPIAPITATIWSLADLLTAFLLLAQFYLNGSLFLGLTAAAYALTGLLTWSYLAVSRGSFARKDS